MLQTVVDGVPVFVADGPRPFSAGLVFGVGRRDESFLRGGLTHLVEHLAMGALGRSSLDANASVDLLATEFTATGSPDRVAAFLRSVCLALADLPTERLAVEADVLRAEGGQVAAPPVAHLLGLLFGATGVGLGSLREPALRSLTETDVRSWAQEWFHRGNAALWVSGPLPEGLSLPLPDGRTPDRAPQHRCPVRTPAWTDGALDGRVTLGAEVVADPALSATLGVLRSRIEDELRHRRGIAYAVEADRVAVDGTARLAVLTTDVRDGEEATAALALWRQTQRLAAEGPLESELAHERELVEEHLADPRAGIGQARVHAYSRVTGLPVVPDEQLRVDVQALTPEAVRRTAEAIRDAAVLALPPGLDARATGLPALPEWSRDVVTGTRFARRRSSAVPRGAALVVGPDGASLDHGDDARVTVRWADVVGLVHTGPVDRVLLDRDGTSLPVLAADWGKGHEAVALVDAAVPAELQVTDDGALAGGVLLLRAPAHEVRAAVAMRRTGGSIVSNGEWTAVVPDDGQAPETLADELTVGLGNSTRGLVLRQDHADLEYVLLRGRQELDRHRWGVGGGDPYLLAEHTSRPAERTAELLRATGTPAELLTLVEAVLGVPQETPDLLARRTVADAELVAGRGVLGAMRATFDGEFLAPDANGFMDRWRRLSVRRPGWYRAVNALAAVVAGAVLVFLVVAPHTLPGWAVAVLAVISGVELVSCLWDTRPPRRAPRDEDPPAGGGAPAPSR